MGAGALALSLTLAACSGSDSGGGATDAPEGESAASIDLSLYDGPDAEALEIGGLEKPADKAVGDCHVGFLQAYAGQINLTAMQDATEEALGEFGCTMTALDGQLNPQTQVSQFQQLLAQGVDAIVLMPIADSALLPLLQQAKDEGVPVIGFNMPGDLSQPRNEFLVTNVSTSFDLACYAVMATLADSRPGSTFAIMGTAIPSNQLQYMSERFEYWGKELGLEYLGKVDALDDNPNAFTPALQSIFSQWPDVENVVTYSDDSALTAATVAAQAGATTVHIADNNGGASTIVPAIESGKIFGTYFVPWAEAGTQMAYAAYLALTEQEAPDTVVLPSQMVTRDTVADFTFVG